MPDLESVSRRIPKFLVDDFATPRKELPDSLGQFGFETIHEAEGLRLASLMLSGKEVKLAKWNYGLPEIEEVGLWRLLRSSKKFSAMLSE